MSGMNIEIKIPLSHTGVEYSIQGGEGMASPIIVSSNMPMTSKPTVTRQVYTAGGPQVYTTGGTQVYTTGGPQQTTVESATMRTSSGRRIEVNVQPSPTRKAVTTVPVIQRGYYVTSPQSTVLNSPAESVVSAPTIVKTTPATVKLVGVSPPARPGVTTVPAAAAAAAAAPPEPGRQTSRVECDEHRFAVTLDVSQYRPEDVEVKVKDNKLTVQAEQRQEGGGAGGGGGFVQREYYRQYTLPDGVDIGQVRCCLSPAKVLTVEIPRVPPTDPRERQIPIVMLDGNQNTVMGGGGVGGKRAYFVDEVSTSDAELFRK